MVGNCLICSIGYKHWCVMIIFLICESVSDLTCLVTFGKKRDLWESEKQEEIILRQYDSMDRCQGKVQKKVYETCYSLSPTPQKVSFFGQNERVFVVVVFCTFPLGNNLEGQILKELVPSKYNIHFKFRLVQEIAGINISVNCAFLLYCS